MRGNRTLGRDAWVAATARGISLTGDGVAYVCLAWRMKEHGTLAVMALTLAMALPMVVAAPWAGVLADRVSAKRLVFTVTTAQSLVALGLVWTGSGPLTVLGLALLALGTAMVNPAWSALLPRLVEQEQLPRAMGLAQSFTAIGNLAGPAVGGALIAVSGTRWPLLLDAASFLAYGLLAWSLRKDRVPEQRRAAGGRFAEMTAGLAVLKRDIVLRTLLLILVMSVLGFAALNVVEVFFVTENISPSSTVYGLLGLVYGLGNLIGAQVFPRFTIAKPRLPVAAVLCELLIAAGLLGFALSRDVWVASVTLIAAGLGNGAINMVFGLLIAYRVPDEVRGRFGAAFGSIITVSSLTSMAIAGGLGTSIDASVIIVAGGVLALIAGLVGLPVMLAAARREQAPTPDTQGATEPPVIARP